MASKQTSECVGREPLGNLCVLREDSLNGWVVMICKGIIGDRAPLGRFSTQSEAETFATAELAKLNASAGAKRFILHVDDCPCWQKEL